MNKISLLTAVMIVFCCGCVVTSLNPFYTDKIVLQSPELVGNWSLIQAPLGSDEDKGYTEAYKPNQIKPWVIDKDEILTFDAQGHSGKFSYKVFKIGDDAFLDAFPGDPESANQFWMFSVYPVHLLFKLTIQKDEFTLTPLNYKWFDEKMKSGQLKLPMAMSVDHGYGIYYPTSEQWVGFLGKNRSEKGLFKDDSKIVLKRISPELKGHNT